MNFIRFPIAALAALLSMVVIVPFVLIGAVSFIAFGSIAVGRDLADGLLEWIQDSLDNP